MTQVLQNRVSSWKVIGIMILFAAVVFFLMFFDNIKTNMVPVNFSAMHNRLSYLDSLEEVIWVKFQENKVYIGFYPIPIDYEIVCNSAAYHGYKAMGVGCHVYAFDASKYPTSGSYSSGQFYSTTFRYGIKK